MKYRDLMAFEPINSVKVLRDADDLTKARRDVSSFVISAQVAETLRTVILPQLQWDDPVDHHGLLAVGSYGSGKTHLMSWLSAIAERRELLDLVGDSPLRPYLERIAGRFCVIRAEIGGVNMSLRDIVCTELQTGLAKLGVHFRFPAASDVTNNKDALRDMMAAFEAVHDGKGLFFVLDELLDFLRSRADAALVQDLTFLREVGEVCGDTRFRFVAGIQEAIFDNPRFASMADSVRRVRARFEQVRISREDIAFVIKRRLLPKNQEQRAWITEHLRAFTPLYEGMAENLQEFVDLFPVHPAYLRVFERITFVEKRDVLKTVSEEMTQLLDRDVPSEEPGLICYDSYRSRLLQDGSNRTIAEVRDALEKSTVVRDRIQRAMVKRADVPIALRIIDGLTVHRLTTEDVYAPIGATRRELKDDLCLLPEGLPERDPLFLEATVDSVLHEIISTVSGQFLSENPQNGQVYLDLRKDIDYDQKIVERAASLDADRLNEAYFMALARIVDRPEQTYVVGHRIWEYELLWHEKSVGRAGYLFMGTPNERSTAQPPRDFYVYFLQPYDTPKFHDEANPEEVFFRLDRPAEEFTGALRRYAGAQALARESTATHRAVYENKARDALQQMTVWLAEHMPEVISVTHLRKARALHAVLPPADGKLHTLRDRIDEAAARMLQSHFATRYPDYPRFEVEVTRDNLEETVRQAIGHILGTRTTRLSTQALRALELLADTGRLSPDGRFARALLERLAAANGRTINRTDLLAQRDGVASWPPWHLEPVWLVVVAAALCQLGRLEIGFARGQVDALTLGRLGESGVAELEGFAHLAPPRAIPEVALREIAELLELPPGILSAGGVSDAAVERFVTAAADLLKVVTVLEGRLRQGLAFWSAAPIEQVDERLLRLGGLRRLLDDIRARNTPGKLARIQADAETLASAREGRQELRHLEAIMSACDHLRDDAMYIQEAAGCFGSDDPLGAEAKGLRDQMLAGLRADQPPAPEVVADFRARCSNLRSRYWEEVVACHRRDRLDAAGDDRKRHLLEGAAFGNADRLAAVQLLPGGTFGALRTRLAEIRSCKEFDPQLLQASVECSACHYRPRAGSGPTAAATLAAMAQELASLLQSWTRTLLEEVGKPDIRARIGLLPTEQQRAVEDFIKRGELPPVVSDGLVEALNQLFIGFEVRPIDAAKLWAALFPEQAPCTKRDVEHRFARFMEQLADGVDDQRLRIQPQGGMEQ